MIRKEVLSIKKMKTESLNSFGRRESLRANKIKIENPVGPSAKQFEIIHKVFPFTQKVTKIAAMIREHDRLVAEMKITPTDSEIMENLLRQYVVRRRQIRMAIGGTKS